MEKDLCTSLTKHLDLPQLPIIDLVAVVEEENEAEEKAWADGMVFAGEVLGESFAQTSLSSSLIVSNTFEVLCLMTLTNCGGATSVMNLAIREFAMLWALEIVIERKKKKNREKWGLWEEIVFLWLWMCMNLVHAWEFIVAIVSFFALTEA